MSAEPPFRVRSARSDDGSAAGVSTLKQLRPTIMLLSSDRRVAACSALSAALELSKRATCGTAECTKRDASVAAVGAEGSPLTCA